MKKFMSAMKSKGKTKTWENDDEAFDNPDIVARKTKKEPKVKINVSAVPSKKAGANGQLVEQVHLQFDDDSASDNSEYKRAFGSGGESSDEYEEFGLESEPVEEPIGTEETKEGQKGEQKEELSPELIAENGRLFVRNLSYACTEENLRTLFEPFGPLTEVHMPIAKETKKPKGFAYILYMIPENALEAYTRLDGTIFQGRLLHVLPSREKPAPKEQMGPTGTTAFKAKQEKERREQAGKDYNWNSLFIRSDTILDAIAAHLGIPKSQIMDVKAASNLATRLAIAETHLVGETKSYLEAQGVQLDAFQGKAERSNTVILVKNLPWDTEAREIRRMFAKFGSLGRVILPPATKAIALVEFLEASEARSAFKSLAYTKFNGVPLYLEWAPMASLKLADGTLISGSEEEEEVVVKAKQSSAAEILDKEAETLSTNTLYVANLNWSTKADSVKQVFSAMGGVKSVKLATKRDPKSGETLSLGFGFVEFDRREAVNRALDQLQGTVIDGHALVLKRSTSSLAAQQQRGEPTKKQKDKTTSVDTEDETATKLIVRNVPFEATERDLKELFHSFAQLKKIRLPKRFNGQHRGFAFVDFLTHGEAKNALTTLAHTHLYGRHLVLEWAKAAAEDGDEAVLDAREKAAKRSIAVPEESNKRARVNLDGIGATDDVFVDQDDEDY